MIPWTGTILALVLLAGVASAQNSDLALLGGISDTRGQSSEAGTTVRISGSTTPSFQVNYAWQILQRKADVYVELPLIVSVPTTGVVVVAPGLVASAGTSDPNLFFTPGLRLKISPESRVSFYAAAGFGIASFGGASIVAPATVVSGNRQNSPAFGFGGGIDIRLTRLLSLRGDVRDFVTRGGLGGIAGNNHATFQVGIAFHF